MKQPDVQTKILKLRVLPWLVLVIKTLQCFLAENVKLLKIKIFLFLKVKSKSEFHLTLSSLLISSTTTLVAGYVCRCSLCSQSQLWD